MVSAMIYAKLLLLVMLATSDSLQKKVVFLRHGCTFMNEYLGRSSFGSPYFTDVFEANELPKYRDSPLSPLGIKQAEKLARSQPSFLRDTDLIVTSPLTRALQTLRIGLGPHLNDDMPIVALPEASERLYLISDVGRPVFELNQSERVDFGTVPHDEWWYKPHHKKSYVEWRPSGQGQRYAVPGEPQHAFDERMTRLWEWIDKRPEQKIALVSHWGVIDWFCDFDFDNCQWRELEWDRVRPKALQKSQR
jgi:broad specificity phosphatase PhoE